MGRGQLDYALLLKTIKAHKPYVYVLLEDAKPETLPESMAFLRRVYGEA
ncbi:MAG: hypothetical protein ACM3ZC_10880 [Bacteroidota bacterium]